MDFEICTILYWRIRVRLRIGHERERSNIKIPTEKDGDYKGKIQIEWKVTSNGSSTCLP